MKMRIIDDKEGTGPYLQIIGTTDQQYRLIIGWGKMHWNKVNKWLEGYADLDLLNRVRKIASLPPAVERYRVELQRTQDAVDRERSNENPKPLYRFPVKMNLYAHQVRGANMALLTFGWIPPGAVP